MLKHGRTQASVAKDAGVARSTLQKWLRAERAVVKESEPSRTAGLTERAERVVARIKEDDPPQHDEEDGDYLSADLLHMSRRMLRDLRALAADATKQGNNTVAQRFMRDAAGVVQDIRRLEKERTSDKDSLTFTRKEIDEATSRMLDTISRLVDRPLLCANCGRALSVHLATRDTGGGSDE